MIEELLKKIILEDVLGSIEAWNILILDDITTYMLSQLLKMDDVIADRKVISVEHVHAAEHSFDKEIAAPVTFFVRPTVENLVRIITSLSKPNSMCKYAHLCFTDAYDEAFRHKINNCAAKNLVTEIKNVNCSFLWAGSHAFYIHFPSSFQLYYNPKLQDFQRRRWPDLADQLATLLIQIGHFPSRIHYLNNNFNSSNLELAEHLLTRMTSFSLRNKKHKWNSTECSVIILDRSFDTITPVLHDITVEPLVRDVVNLDYESMQPNKYTYPITTKASTKHKHKSVKMAPVESRTIFLDANNEAWCKVRYMNMKLALLHVSETIDHFMSGGMLEAGKTKNLTFHQFRDLIKMYPIQRKRTDAYGGLSYLLNETLAHYTIELVQVEQHLAGKMLTSANSSDWSVVSELLELSNTHQLNKPLSIYDKIRILYLYARSKFSESGLTNKELERAFESMHVPLEYMKGILNLRFLSIPVLDADGSWTFYSAFQRRKNRRKRGFFNLFNTRNRPDDMPDYITWLPEVYEVVKDMIENPQLVLDYLPFIDAPKVPEVRKAASKNNPFARPSYIVFFVGGLSYSEMKYSDYLTEMFSKTHGTFVLFGGTDLLTPNEFIDLILELDQDP